MKKFIPNVFSSFVKDDCLNLAAIISFYAIFSIIPLTMISISLIGHFVGASLPGVIGEITSALSSVLPQVTSGVVQNIENIVARKAGLGWVGLIFLVLVASLLFSSLEQALDKVFRSVRKRNFLHSRLVSIALIFLAALMFFIPAMLRPALGVLAEFGLSLPIAKILTANTFFFLLAFLSFTSFVTIIPTHRVLLRYSVVGGVVFTALTGLARYLFRMYILTAWSRYDLIYGSLTALIVAIIWVYYFANIFLLSAEVVARLQERRKGSH